MVALLGVALAAAACGQPGESPFRSTGSYPFDIFQEMHYNQSFKAQEPPRLLPPADSVPVTGKEVPLPAIRSEAASLENPVVLDAASLERAGVLFHINCSACHGQTAGGDGFVGQRFVVYGVTSPPAFASDRVGALSPGEAFWSLTNGFGLMPPFGRLLTAEERWLLVHVIDLPAAERTALLERTEAPGY